MLLTLLPIGEGPRSRSLDDAAFEFRELFKNNLPTEAIYTQCGNLQYAILFPFCNTLEVRRQVGALLEIWRESDFGREYEIAHEQKLLGEISFASKVREEEGSAS